MSRVSVHRLLGVLLLGPAMFLTTVYAQVDEGDPPVYHNAAWATAGIGTSRFGPCGVIGMSYADESHVLTLRYAAADEFRFNVDGAYATPAMRLREFGLMYGRSFRQRSVVVSFQAGVGYVSAVDRGRSIQYNDHERVTTSTLAVPFEASVRFESGIFGIGGSWYGNFNAKNWNSGAIFQISIGSF